MTGTLNTMLAKLHDFVDSVTDGEWTSETSRYEALALIAQMQRDAVQPPEPTLPFDVQVGHNRFRKGVALSVFVAAAQRWHREAFPEGYALTDEQKAANLANLQGLAAPQPAPEPQQVTGFGRVAGTMALQHGAKFKWPQLPEPQQDDHAGSPAPSTRGIPVAEYLAKVKADPRRAAAMERVRQRFAAAESSKAALSDDEIDDWWATENGLEDMNMAKRSDFRAVVRAILARAGTARKPLTLDEILTIKMDCEEMGISKPYVDLPRFVRAIEAAHGIKGEA